MIEKCAIPINWVSRVFYKLSELCIVLLTITVLAGVVARYVFNHPFHWSDEMACYLFVFVVFMGAADVARQDKHIAVDLILNRLLPKNRNKLLLINLILSLFWSFCLTWVTWKNTVISYKFDMYSSTLFRCPLYIPYSFMAIGFTLLFLEFLLITRKEATNLLELRGKKL
ncbi:MAG: TRAP transporter small permease [Eubacteriales bacterium]